MKPSHLAWLGLAFLVLAGAAVLALLTVLAGPAYDGARSVVRAETVLFLQRMASAVALSGGLGGPVLLFRAWQARRPG